MWERKQVVFWLVTNWWHTGFIWQQRCCIYCSLCTDWVWGLDHGVKDKLEDLPFDLPAFFLITCHSQAHREVLLKITAQALHCTVLHCNKAGEQSARLRFRKKKCVWWNCNSVANKAFNLIRGDGTRHAFWDFQSLSENPISESAELRLDFVPTSRCSTELQGWSRKKEIVAEHNKPQ